MSSLLSGFVGAVVGAVLGSVIGGVIAYLSARKIFNMQTRSDMNKMLLDQLLSIQTSLVKIENMTYNIVHTKAKPGEGSTAWETVGMDFELYSSEVLSILYCIHRAKLLCDNKARVRELASLYDLINGTYRKYLRTRRGPHSDSSITPQSLVKELTGNFREAERTLAMISGTYTGMKLTFLIQPHFQIGISQREPSA